MATFIGIVHKDEKSDYGVCFPDFPGCITAGTTLDDAMAMAREALSGHIEVMYEHHDPLPTKAMTLDQAKKHEFAKGATMFIAVEAPLPCKPIRVNVMLDANLVERIDRFANNRSAFLSQAARNELARQHPAG
jgi:predicted RNase H-like HicB family nuclease